MTETLTDGLSLAPFRGLRPRADSERLARLLCPPYDVIDARARADLLAGDPDNAVAVILPEPTPTGYAGAAEKLRQWEAEGLYLPDDEPSLYVYEMRDANGAATRGLLGAVELRDPADGVILPHENTMAGPVADRLEVMTATEADLEPIYLVYDGGGAASALVREADGQTPVAETTTPDGITHRLWAISNGGDHDAVAQDLAGRRALIADGHHRYATYRERQRIRNEADGPGPWDRGLALIVDSTDYGPQVHAIHRVIPGLRVDEAVNRIGSAGAVRDVPLDAALAEADAVDGFAVVLTDGERTVLVTDPDGSLAAAAGRPGDVKALTDLDVTVVHRGLVEQVWQLADDVETVGYAHTVNEALTAATESAGLAVLLRPTPVAAVAAVAAVGARMPRKSTFFTPKPASGLVMRRLADQRVVHEPAP
jgi:uncharacterized protein (DUF1015 family)